jgi:hypothetical protein
MTPGGRVLRRLSINLLLAGASLALSLLLAEGALRLAGYQALYDIYSRPSQFWQYDALLGWVHEPGAGGRFVGPRPWPVEFDTPVEINSLGFRGPEPAAGGGAGALRVLFLGDSMVAGFEVAHADTFVAQVAPALGARLGRPVESFNGGVRGYGGDQYLLAYQQRGRALAPDAVVVFHSTNDPLDNLTLHETRRPFGKAALRPGENGRLERIGVPVPHYGRCEEVSLSPSFAVVRRQGLGFRVLCEAQSLLLDHSALLTFLTLSIPWSSDQLSQLYHLGNPHATRQQAADDRAWQFTHATRILEALTREVTADGAVMFLTGAPKDLARLDLERLRAAGARVRDLGEVWSLPREQMRWQHDSHFNPEGHRRVAQILAPWLEEGLRGRTPQKAK